MNFSRTFDMMKKPGLIILFIACFLSASCQQKGNNLSASQLTLSPQAFSDSITRRDVLLLDVRTPEEFAGGHIHGAVNIDYNNPDFKSNIRQLDNNQPVYIYCLAGKRSESSMELLAEAGFQEIYNLDGGTLKWISEGRPMDTNVNALPQSPGMSAEQYLNATRSSEITIMDFNATWCGPCKQLAPVLEKLEKDYKGRIKVVKVDVDENRTLAQSKSISTIPFLEIYKNGKLVMQHEGYTTYEDLLKIIPL